MGQGDVGIVGIGAALGARRLDLADVAAAWGRSGRGSLAVADTDEDPLTLGWDAAVAALDAARVPPGEIDGLWWGTTRAPFAEGPSWVHLAATLRLGDSVVGALCCGSPHSGVEALLAAADAIATGTVERALVIMSDAPRPGLGSGAEIALGAGAVAVVLSHAGPAKLAQRATRWITALDRYRGDLETDTRESYDGRLFREEVFVPTVSACASALDAGAETRWSLPDPDGRLAAVVAKRLGATVVSTATRRHAGDLGAAAAFAGLIDTLAEPGVSALCAFGGGRSTAVEIAVTAAVPGVVAASAALGSAGRPIGYAELLRARGQLVASGERVEMAVPPGSAMFVRDNRTVLGLIGARCDNCGAVNFPPGVHPTCTACGGDKFTESELSRTGTVQTFVINQTMPAPFVAPLPLVCVDLDDGSRVMFQGQGPGDGIEIGAPVELVLRRYTIERGVPIYGWKVRARAVAVDGGGVEAGVAS